MLEAARDWHVIVITKNKWTRQELPTSLHVFMGSSSNHSLRHAVPTILEVHSQSELSNRGVFCNDWLQPDAVTAD